MSFVGTFLSWFLEHFTSEDVDMLQLILTLGLTTINAVYLFFVYRLLTRKTIYAKRYNITISAVALITASIIFTVQSDIRLSLGVVGALAIVRLRTAIKEPLDVVFLFWAVVVGICCGGHMAEISFVLSAILTIVIFYLEGNSVKSGYRLLILECDELASSEDIRRQLHERCKRYRILLDELEEKNGKMVVEIVIKKELPLLQKLQNISGVKSISLITHEGEHCY